MSKVHFSIIVVTHNSEDCITTALSSIYRQQPEVDEVIVVDNGSVDKTIELVQHSFPRALLITNQKNEGVCKARNQGLEVSKGEWIMTLDCDAILETGFTYHIQEAIHTVSSDVGIIQPKILMSDAKTIYSLGIYLSPMRRFFDIKHGYQDKQDGDIREVFGACAAAAVYRRTMLEELKEKTGYFDERFFFLVEDVDLAWRAYRKDWKAVLYPQALCYHSGNSSHMDKKFRQYLCFRNRFYSIVKNEGIVGYSKKILPIFFYDFPRLCWLVFSNPYVYSDTMRLLRSQAQRCAIFTSD